MHIRRVLFTHHKFATYYKGDKDTGGIKGNRTKGIMPVGDAKTKHTMRYYSKKQNI